MTKIVLCADIGTSSLKAALIDNNGTVIAQSRSSFKDIEPSKASQQWLTALLDASKELAISTQNKYTPDALCISGNGPTLVTQEGTTLLWNAPAYTERQVIGPSLFIPRLLTLKNTYKKEYKESTTIFSGPEYLIYQLTGKKLTILPEQRYISAYWDTNTLINNGFTTEEAVKLPPFVKPGDNGGSFTESAYVLFSSIFPNISHKTIVYCGAPDFVSALAGSGTLKSGMICDRAGSSEGINLCTSIPIRGDGIRTLPSVIPGLWNASVLIPQSGVQFTAYKKYVEKLRGEKLSYESIIEYFLQSSKEDEIMYQGKQLLTDLALSVRNGLNTLKQAIKDTDIQMPPVMTITGGQAKNKLWAQYKSNITGISISVPECSDSELIGDAVFAFTGMGLYKDFVEASETICHSGKTYNPQ